MQMAAAVGRRIRLVQSLKLKVSGQEGSRFTQTMDLFKLKV